MRKRKSKTAYPMTFGSRVKTHALFLGALATLVLVGVPVANFALDVRFPDSEPRLRWENAGDCRASPTALSGSGDLDAPLCMKIPNCTQTMLDRNLDCAIRNRWLELEQGDLDQVRLSFRDTFGFAMDAQDSTSGNAASADPYEELVAQAFGDITPATSEKWKKYLLWQIADSQSTDDALLRLDRAEAIRNSVTQSPRRGIATWQARAAKYSDAVANHSHPISPQFSTSGSRLLFVEQTSANLVVLLA